MKRFAKNTGCNKIFFIKNHPNQVFHSRMKDELRVIVEAVFMLKDWLRLRCGQTSCVKEQLFLQSRSWRKFASITLVCSYYNFL